MAVSVQRLASPTRAERASVDPSSTTATNPKSPWANFQASTRLQYNPLDPQQREIRILTLQPGRLGEPIIGNLDAVSLDDDPPFESLSYCWGDKTESRDIIVDGFLCRVTKNLHGALQRLRNEASPRRLWVDAVCINQDDNVEKSHQVGLMKDIFKAATETTLFIGDYIDDPNPSPYELFDPDIPLGSQFGVESTFALIQKLAEGYHLFYYESPYRDADHLPPNSLKLRHACTKGILSLVSQPWWSRIWTVQEAILPKNPIIQYGSQCASWEVFSAAAKKLEQHMMVDRCCRAQYGPGCRSVQPPTVKFWAKITRLIELRKSPLPLEQLLRSFRDRCASDPRDMVYGLLGLAREEDIPFGIRPDYTIGTPELYSTVTRELIRRRGDLCWLGPHRFENEEAPRLCGLPSWVPDYTTISEWISIFEEVTPSAYWNPRDFRPVHLEPTKNDPLTLTVHGIHFDDIIAVGDAVLPCPRVDLFAKIAGWQSILHSMGLWQTQHPPGDFEGTYEELWWMIACRGLLLTYQDSDEEQFRPATTEDRKDVELPIASPAEELSGMMPQLLWWERFFVTRKGYIGLTLQNVRVGDAVHVLVGGRTPMVLRKVTSPSEEGVDFTSNHYGFVGDAFVLGVMKGGLLPPEGGDGLESYKLV